MRTRCLLLCMMTLLCAGCESARFVPGYGQQPCIGLGETPDPRFHYKLSAWNTLLGVVFVELLVPPIVVLANETFCPVRAKEGTPHAL